MATLTRVREAPARKALSIGEEMMRRAMVAVRTATGLSQTRWAAKLGVDASTVHRWETPNPARNIQPSGMVIAFYQELLSQPAIRADVEERNPEALELLAEIGWLRP